MRCKKCKDHEQITKEEFDNLPYDKQRKLDCKNLTKDGQCDCYSKEHCPEEFKIKKNILKNTKESIIEYLTMQRRYVFKTTLSKDLLILGFKKTNISKGLSILRKEKAVGYYRRRWGLK